MSEPLSKRRRISTSNGLLKPFKSPMRTQDAGSTKTQRDQGSLQPRKQDPGQNFVARLKQLKTVKQESKQTNEFSQLRREEMALLSQISKLKAELGQVKQARSIEESDKEKELVDLIKLWRTASQQAAEEVYAVFRDKVNAVGGMRRWTQMEKERKIDSFPFEEIKKGDEENAIDGEEDSNLIKSQEEFVPEGGEEEEEGETTEPATLSMDVMLHYLKIEPRIIGYDVENQRWLI